MARDAASKLSKMQNPAYAVLIQSAATHMKAANALSVYPIGSTLLGILAVTRNHLTTIRCRHQMRMRELEAS
jgi:hypothetical protein